MSDVTLFGGGPAGPHFTNLLFHAVNGVLLFLLLRRLTGAVWRSVLVAAGLVLTACAIRSKNQLRYWQNDETFFRHAVALNPNYARGYLALGYYFENNGQWEEAIKNYRAFIRIDPDNVIAHSNLGVVLENGGHFEAVVVEYREAVRLAPQIPEVHYNLGCVLAKLGRRDEAIGQLTQTLRLNPDFAPAKEQLRTLDASPSSGQ